MHHRMPGERPGQDEPHQSFIHHHGASGHIVLDQKLVQSAPLRRHLLVFHIGGRDLLLFLIHYTHVAVHEERNCTCGILRFFVVFRHRCLRISRCSRLLRLSHGGQRLFHFVRMPDVVLIRKHIILAGRRLAGRRQRTVPCLLCKVLQGQEEMAGGAAGGYGPEAHLDALRVLLRIFSLDLLRSVGGDIIRNKQTDALFRLL